MGSRKQPTPPPPASAKPAPPPAPPAASAPGPAPAEELEAYRWLTRLIETRDSGLRTYTPVALQPRLQAEQDRAFEIAVPLGRLRLISAYIARLRARELAR